MAAEHGALSDQIVTRFMEDSLYFFFPHCEGLTGKQTRKGVCLCISTAYEGVYLDSYYLDLLVKQPVRIRRHSIPPFIPLNQISDEYLQTDIRRFLAVLSEHLNAYAGRKFQAEQLQVGGQESRCLSGVQWSTGIDMKGSRFNKTSSAC